MLKGRSKGRLFHITIIPGIMLTSKLIMQKISRNQEYLFIKIVRSGS